MRLSPICPRWLYVSVLLVSLINISVLVSSRATFQFSKAWPLGVLIVLLFAVYLQRPKSTELPYWKVVVFRLCEGLLFLQLAWLNIRTFNHLSMMMPVPLTDDLLLKWDQMLGLDWLAYFEFVHAHPSIIKLYDASYESLSLLSLCALIVLCFFRDPRRVRYFVEVFFTTAMFCAVVGAFFPAKAAVFTLIPDLAAYPNFAATPPGIYHLVYLDTLRDATKAVALDPNSMPGLVTFPSFHTAAGIILILAFWRTWLFVPVLLYSVVMIASTPVFGGHYFIDLVAGTAVALAIGHYFASRPLYSGLFTSKKPNLVPSDVEPG